MKLSCLALSLLCSTALLGYAETAGQPAQRTLPSRVNGNPPPPAPTPPLPPVEKAANLPPSTVKPVAPPPAPVALPANLLAWDAETKEYNLKPGELEAHFTFYFTNISSDEVVIRSAAASCGCTVPKLPPVPWTNAPGAVGEIPVTMNMAGKSGLVFKTVTVTTDKGNKMLTVKATVPAPQPVAAAPMDRNKNQELAKADRQAVFRGDCARCHVEPTKGKLGKELYEKACGICHDAEHRAEMVADLKKLNHDTNADYWKTWISQGKPGSLMPAFAQSQGGPLTEDQINSLVQYLVATIPTHAARPPQASLK